MADGMVIVWPRVAYCPWHQSYEPWYAHSYGYLGEWSHVDPQHYPSVGGDWHGMHIYENCRYCAQPLVATAHPRMNYCPNCGSYQPHLI